MNDLPPCAGFRIHYIGIGFMDCNYFIALMSKAKKINSLTLRRASSVVFSVAGRVGRTPRDGVSTRPSPLGTTSVFRRGTHDPFYPPGDRKPARKLERASGRFFVLAQTQATQQAMCVHACSPYAVGLLGLTPNCHLIFRVFFSFLTLTFFTTNISLTPRRGKAVVNNLRWQ